MEKKNDYRISFFKPTTAFSKINRNLVIVLVIIWAVAIFGFQILLKVVEKPTPESSLFTFEEVWSNVKDGNASLDEKIKFADAVLSVLGKSTILAKPQKKATLNNAFSWIVYDMIAEEEKENFNEFFVPAEDNIEKTAFKFIIQELLDNEIKVIYTINPVKNSNIYDYIDEKCFKEIKITKILSSHELKNCEEIDN